uniref:Uncharacterized protein n=1 Tax=Panagrolaimus davidi TaxID=227884 RepID=A0A914Q6L9_9BILA
MVHFELLIHELVNQIFVDGKTTESFLIAIIVINIKALEAELGKPSNSRYKALVDKEPDFLDNDYVREFVVQELRIFGASKGLNTLEQIKAAELTLEEFTVESGLLTPTLKIKRQQMRQKYEKTIEKLYSDTNGF